MVLTTLLLGLAVRVVVAVGAIRVVALVEQEPLVKVLPEGTVLPTFPPPLALAVVVVQARLALSVRVQPEVLGALELLVLLLARL